MVAMEKVLKIDSVSPQHLSNSLFYGECGGSRMDIIGWWEQRRFRYNVYVGFVGFVTWWLVLIAGSAAVKPGVDFEEPLAMLFGPFFYGIAANVCYTLDRKS